MDKVDKILGDEEFRRISLMIKEKEYDRIYCRHSLGHALSVARIALIMCLENKYDIDRELIYGAALLHDIGRYSVYEEEGMSHHAAGAIIAREILTRAGYNENDIALICDAIEKHKNFSGDETSLAGILFKADKLSRNCFMCEAKPTCYWPESIKNGTITY